MHLSEIFGKDWEGKKLMRNGECMHDDCLNALLGCVTYSAPSPSRTFTIRAFYFHTHDLLYSNRYSPPID